MLKIKDYTAKDYKTGGKGYEYRDTDVYVSFLLPKKEYQKL